MSTKLGVNIDHVATIRQARQTAYPDILEAARAAIAGGADQITIHLREDRRHIQECDVIRLQQEIDVPLNLEMAATDEMVAKALEYKPDRVTLVPEKRRELTTEGGLDLLKKKRRLNRVIKQLASAGIATSLFIDPEEDQINAAVELACKAIELHTGRYADADDDAEQSTERERLLIAARFATSKHLFVAAGHGLHLDNIANVASIKEIREFNIGHSLIARALFTGLEAAVREMKLALDNPNSTKGL